MSHHPKSARSNVRRLATGRLISVTGGAAAYTALQFTVWETTHSPGMHALSLLLTFGVAYFFVNVVMLLFTEWVTPDFSIDGFWTYVGATIVVSLVNLSVGWILDRVRG